MEYSSASLYWLTSMFNLCLRVIFCHRSSFTWKVIRQRNTGQEQSNTVKKDSWEATRLQIGYQSILHKAKTAVSKKTI